MHLYSYALVNHVNNACWPGRHLPCFMRIFQEEMASGEVWPSPAAARPNEVSRGLLRAA